MGSRSGSGSGSGSTGVIVEPKSNGRGSIRADSNDILSACAVVQSSLSTPLVSPVLGFHDQKVQLMPVRPR